MVLRPITEILVSSLYEEWCDIMGLSVKTLEFSNLPLLRVGIRLTFDEHLSENEDKIVSLKKSLDDVGRLTLVSEDHSQGKLIEWHNEEDGIDCALYESFLMVYWVRTDDKPYPRFPALMELAVLSLDSMLMALPETIISQVSVIYAQLLKSAAGERVDVTHYLRSEFVGFLNADRIPYDIDIAWRSMNNIDYRLEVDRHPHRNPKAPETEADSEVVILQTTGGSFVRDEKPFVVLERVHDGLQDVFVQVVSDKALLEWGHGK